MIMEKDIYNDRLETMASSNEKANEILSLQMEQTDKECKKDAEITKFLEKFPLYRSRKKAYFFQSWGHLI